MAAKEFQCHIYLPQNKEMKKYHFFKRKTIHIYDFFQTYILKQFLLVYLNCFLLRYMYLFLLKFSFYFFYTVKYIKKSSSVCVLWFFFLSKETIFKRKREMQVVFFMFYFCKAYFMASPDIVMNVSCLAFMRHQAHSMLIITI